MKIEVLKEELEGEVKGMVYLQYDTEINRYFVFGELCEYPELKCEKTLKLKLIALWYFFKFKRKLESISITKEHIWNWYIDLHSGGF